MENPRVAVNKKAVILPAAKGLELDMSLLTNEPV